MKQFICYNAGCDIFEIVPYNQNIEWHQEEYKGTYNDCVKEKKMNECDSYLFNNFLPANGNEDTLMEYHF
jgi:hypothetical protein